LALVCLWASGFGGAGLWDLPSELGVAFLLVGVPALWFVHQSVPVHWRWRRRPLAGGLCGFLFFFVFPRMA
jgi:hypothetical protein